MQANDLDRSLSTKKDIIGQHCRSSLRKEYPPEWSKTLIMLVYAISCLSAMTFIITIVHDRVPGNF